MRHRVMSKQMLLEKVKECLQGFSGGSACSLGDPDSIRGLGRPPGEGNGYPLQYSYQENSWDRGAWRATAHGVAELDMTEQLTLHFRLA